ncbi:MAG: aspartate aminotransferase family protein [Sulfobacillus acidophilus]|uniref:Aspartate aminotransferase family protein n=1 Tax=Sulfobacillus acidophilus TaxID=53633 RepID=A0A2T2WNT2_9FIRM|nr:MAG: aspartate aminotransferase family protein [Sulfobacillus acidophilus]
MTHVFYRSPSRSYPMVSHASGVYLWDTEGKRYLDGSSGALVVNVGHGRTEVVQAMAQQAQRVAFAHTMRFTSQAQERLGALLAERLEPERYYTYLVSGGSEATETAIKLARQYHLERGDERRTKIMSRWASYHGNTLGALAASGHLARRRPYSPLFAHQTFVHFDVPVAQAHAGPCSCLDSVQARIQQEDPRSIAALIIEVVGGSALSGFVPHAGYLKGLEDICRQHGILLIVDEVMTGMGRTGSWWAHTTEGLRPDLMTLAKGLSSGYSPLGAVVAHETVWRTVAEGTGSFAHGFTYGGNPVSAAAANAVIEIMEQEHLVANAKAQGERLHQGLLALAAQSPLISQVRGRGLMQGVVLQSLPGEPGTVATRLGQDAFSHGLIVYPGSGSPDRLDGDHLLIGPPLSIRPHEVDELLEGFAASVQRVAQTLGMS